MQILPYNSITLLHVATIDWLIRRMNETNHKRIEVPAST